MARSMARSMAKRLIDNVDGVDGHVLVIQLVSTAMCWSPGSRQLATRFILPIAKILRKLGGEKLQNCGCSVPLKKQILGANHVLKLREDR